MKVLSILLLLVGCISATAAHPKEPSPAEYLRLRACVGRDIQGDCLDVEYSPGCHAIRPDYDDRVSSVETFNPGVNWTIWSDPSCLGRGLAITAILIVNLDDYNFSNMCELAKAFQ
ncbi:hypothetical protein BT63DRAFT_413558 [Microthyrium microscopicum]|uniref:Uncharacterized protein n=1 Tax=Microthyrium microscopicum TaxID=703497 RepID=A0A6A6UA78_9PEZI|nr:hypothetical protein BT63DRAFT_413558 [Microthyrium microscopicum]